MQMRLRADAVDGDAGGAPGLDFGDEAGGFGVGGAVKAVMGGEKGCQFVCVVQCGCVGGAVCRETNL